MLAPAAALSAAALSAADLSPADLSAADLSAAAVPCLKTGILLQIIIRLLLSNNCAADYCQYFLPSSYSI
jgi:uncharacterized protein YjbI with pentapeptide repeats